LALVVTASTASCGNIIIDTSGVYVAQAPAGDKNGRGCSNARALGDLTPADWVAGNTIHLCGTITFPAGSAGLVAQGSGTSSSPIIVKFETNAILEAPYFGGSLACWSAATCLSGIEIYGYHDIIVDGGTNGIIENTANGSDLANQQSSAGLVANGDRIIARNLTIKNIYINDPSTLDTKGANSVDVLVFPGATNVTLCDNKLSDARTGIDSAGAGTVVPVYPSPSCSSNTFTAGQNYFGNSLTDFCWMFNLGGSTANTINVFDNNILWTNNWVDANDDFHNDGMIVYGTPQTTVYAYDNVFRGPMQGTANIYCTYTGSAGSGSSCYIFDNLMVQDASVANSGSAIWLNLTTGETAAGPFYVYNNTIVNFGYFLELGGDIAGETTIENNLVSEGTSGYNYFYMKGYGSNSLPSILTTADYNSFYGGRGLSFTGAGYWCWPANGGSPSNCGSSYNGPWVRTGLDTHSISANPQMNASYQLSSNSPDIRAGANLSSLCATPGLGPLCYDKNGVARPLTGPWDIGAYQ
jgi:hypothetical protein